MSLAVAFLAIGIASGCGSHPGVLTSGSSNNQDEFTAPTPHIPKDSPQTPDSHETGTESPTVPSEMVPVDTNETPEESAPKIPSIVIDPSILGPKDSEPAPSGGYDILITSGVLSHSDVTPPEYFGISSYGIGQKFVVTIHFSEPVDVASIATNQSIVLYRGSISGYVPMKGSLFSVADKNGQIGSSLTFYDADDANTPKYNGDPLAQNFLLKIYGADSDDPSRAVKDRAGNSLAHEVIETGQCFDSTITGASSDIVPCQ